MPDTLADRLGLWEPCPNLGFGLHGRSCDLCDSGTGRVLNPAAVRTAWAMVEDADKESMTLALLRLRARWTQELEAAGAERPKEFAVNAQAPNGN